MKIGIIADIHSNFDALEAVYDYFINHDINHLICLGDIIGIGNQPELCVQFLKNHEGRFLSIVRGNHEDYALKALPVYNHNDPRFGKLPQSILDLFDWNHGQLSKDSLHWLRKLPPEDHLRIEDVSLYISHYPLDQNAEYRKFFLTPDLKECSQLFRGKDARVNLFGHTHIACYQKSKTGKHYINPGSTGCPVGTDQAAAGILELDHRRVKYKQIFVPYDVKPVVDDLLSHSERLPALSYTIDQFYKTH